MNKMYLTISLLSAAALCLLFFRPVAGQTQVYPDTMWAAVTFYDFHANGSNPEFEPAEKGGLHVRMVDTVLNSLRKPALGTTPFFNYYINKWFRPWTSGDYTIPLYTDSFGTYGGIRTVNYDTAFKNVMIYDSLPFIHISNGIYIFDHSGQNGTSQFFWLDGKGFGNEPTGFTHNFSFTMELHTQFTYQSGLLFDFLGDDDVWAFVNGHLVMDLGGIHSSLSGTVRMDSIGQKMQLVVGQKYPLDFFYAERHTTQSCIKITTNMITYYRGPEVTHAEVYLHSSADAPDTLVVTFGTPIRCAALLAVAPESSFVFIDDASSASALHNAVYQGTCSSEYISSISLLTTDRSYLKNIAADSIGFVVGSPHVVDRSGIHPLIPTKSHLVLNITPAFEVTPYPTPSSPDKVIDSRISQAYGPVIGDNKYGTIVGIYSKVPLQNSNATADQYGSADLYDATGNIVEHDLPLKSAGRDGVYGVYWNIKNRNGRIVGNGTYLMIIKATFTDGTKTQERVKIAVKR